MHLGSRFGGDIYRRYTNPTRDELKRDGPAGEVRALRKSSKWRRVERDAYVPAPLPHRRPDARDDIFEYEAARRRAGRQQSGRRRRLEGSEGDLDQERRHQFDTGAQKSKDADSAKTARSTSSTIHDGRDLHIEYAEKSLNLPAAVVGREVVLETVLDGKRSLLCSNDRGFSVRALQVESPNVWNTALTRAAGRLRRRSCGTLL